MGTVNFQRPIRASYNREVISPAIPLSTIPTCSQDDVEDGPRKIGWRCGRKHRLNESIDDIEITGLEFNGK